jgi:transcriptional regulator with PAS, ATPase and Fis domain
VACNYLLWRVNVVFSDILQNNVIEKIGEKVNPIENTNDSKMKELLDTAHKISNTNIPVLITGETGTGKELLADYIQGNSSRKDKVYYKINCAAIPDTLIESEFFGHLRGSFTGATVERVGIFELSNNGTIFLDEIGDLSLQAQSKILRVLQDQKVKKIGSGKTETLNFRVITASNKNLESNEFRRDLYYRINGVKFDIPPLRSRKNDIEILVNYYIEKYSNELNRNKPLIDETSLGVLTNYHWPGNVRELENIIRVSVSLSNGYLNVNPDFIKTIPMSDIGSGNQNEFELGLEHNEKRLILSALMKTHFVQKEAAKLLSVSPRAINYKIRYYGITHPSWKSNK